MNKPLSPHALGVLADLAKAPMPAMEINPGVHRKLAGEGLVETVQLKSPYKKHRGGLCEHLALTARGKALVARA